MYKQMKATVKVVFRTEIVFRMNFIFLFFGLPLKILISWVLWDFVIGTSASFNGLTRNQILVFVAFTSFLNYLYDSNTLLSILQHKLINGGAVSDLTLPISLHRKEIFGSWGTFILYAISGLITLSAIIIVGNIEIHLNFAKIIILVVITLINTVLQYYVVSIIASLSVLIGRVDDIKYLLLNVLEFFGGMIIPLAIFPASTRFMLYLNPISSVIDFPASILITETLDLTVIAIRFLIQLLWLVILMQINNRIWKISRDRFTAPGE